METCIELHGRTSAGGAPANNSKLCDDRRHDDVIFASIRYPTTRVITLRQPTASISINDSDVRVRDVVGRARIPTNTDPDCVEWPTLSDHDSSKSGIRDKIIAKACVGRITFRLPNTRWAGIGCETHCFLADATHRFRKRVTFPVGRYLLITSVVYL